MMKVLELALTTILLLSYISCTQQSQRQSNVAPRVATTTPVATPTPTPANPLTASVNGANFKWQDSASGTPVTTIKVGGQVTWTITSGTHSLARVAASSENGCDELDTSFDSDTLSSGQTVSRTFSKAGTFGYSCGIHGGNPNCKAPPGSGRMPGVIKVVP
jgi:plastocyanin